MNRCNRASATSLPEDRGKRVCYALGMVLGVYVADQVNYWNPMDPNRALSNIGGCTWKGRVKMADEYYKFVADGNWRFNWGTHGIPFGLNMRHEIPGIFDVIFDEEDPGNPRLILVKPFSEWGVPR
jgi:hypothetical protein